MKRLQRTIALGAVVVSLSGMLAADARAQTDPNTPPPVMPPVDTAAVNALTRMGTFLRTLTDFGITANIVTEKVLQDGQKIQRISKVDLVSHRPNKLRASMTDDRSERTFVYDGVNFTIWAPQLRYYSTAPAPATMNELADQLEEKFNLELPLVDLFRWGSDGPASDFGTFTTATDVGPSQINGTTVEQYAFRQEGMDWQVWIQKGTFPLPRRIVMTTMTDDARPQHTIIYDWNLAPSFNDASFVFVPPDGAKEIPIATVTAAAQNR